MNLEPGDQIADRFLVEALLGEGAMARVYRVRHLGLGSVYALKLLSISHPSLATRLLQEGRIQAQLRHPNVVTVTDIVEHEGRIGLLMEYVDGPTLERLITQQRLGINEALSLFARILAGVTAAHAAGVLHRDLKPANVLLARKGDRWYPKVTDFGIARLLMPEPGQGHTRHGIPMGTPGYMAPEQARDATGVDARADIFSLAAILYEMVSGQPALSKDLEISVVEVHDAVWTPLQELVPECPTALAQAVQKALSFSPDDRPLSCLDLAESVFAETPELLRLVQRPSPNTSLDMSFDDSNIRSRAVRTRVVPPPAPPRPQSPPIIPLQRLQIPIDTPIAPVNNSPQIMRMQIILMAMASVIIMLLAALLWMVFQT